MKYEIKVRRMADDYSGTTIAEATVEVPGTLGPDETEAMGIVSAMAVGIFADSTGKVISELGRKAMRRRDSEGTQRDREATADEAEAAGRDPGMRDTGEPMMVPVGSNQDEGGIPVLGGE